MRLHQGNVLHLYDQWESPVVIVSDGPYGLGGRGDVKRVDELPGLYSPHAERWAAAATAQTTLWFWNTEVGWALVHPVLARHGWVYRQCCVWDKGLTHAVNKSNTRTLRKLPTVTEVCVQYVRATEHRQRPRSDHSGASTQSWLRSEWLRTGLPLNEANRACGLRTMVTRRYLTADHHWYCPPVAVVRRLATYANLHGDRGGRPFFSVDGIRPVTTNQWRRTLRGGTGDWERRRAKYFCAVGLTNVWRANPVRGAARVRMGTAGVHPNQKPLELMERILALSSEEGDLVWEPFGGLFTTSLACIRMRRRCVAAERSRHVFGWGVARIRDEVARRRS